MSKTNTKSNQVTVNAKSKPKRDDNYDVEIGFLTANGTSAVPSYNAAQMVVNGGANFLGGSYTILNASYSSFSTPASNECSPSDPNACNKSGVCTVSGSGSICSCKSGYRGDQCTVYSPVINQISGSSYNFKVVFGVSIGLLSLLL